MLISLTGYSIITPDIVLISLRQPHCQAPSQGQAHYYLVSLVLISLTGYSIITPDIVLISLRQLHYVETRRLPGVSGAGQPLRDSWGR